MVSCCVQCVNSSCLHGAKLHILGGPDLPPTPLLHPYFVFKKPFQDLLFVQSDRALLGGGLLAG